MLTVDLDPVSWATCLVLSPDYMDAYVFVGATYQS